MKDSEKVVVKAFLFALTQQRTPLPPELQSQLNKIANSLDENVVILRDLALKTPSLTNFYTESFNWLISQIANRGMGKDFLPAETSPSETSLEIENITRDPRTEIERLERIIRSIEIKLDKTTSILSANNSVILAQQEFLG